MLQIRIGPRHGSSIAMSARKSEGPTTCPFEKISYVGRPSEPKAVLVMVRQSIEERSKGSTRDRTGRRTHPQSAARGRTTPRRENPPPSRSEAKTSHASSPCGRVSIPPTMVRSTVPLSVTHIPEAIRSMRMGCRLRDAARGTSGKLQQSGTGMRFWRGPATIAVTENVYCGSFREAAEVRRLHTSVQRRV